MAELNGAAEVVEGVVLPAAEEVGRALDGYSLGLGLAIGAGVGFAVGSLYISKRLRKEYEAIAEEEISQMRDHFHKKAVAMENKPALDGLVRDLGYVPAERQTEEGDQAATVSPDPSTPNSTVNAESETQNVFEQPEPPAEELGEAKEPNEGWDYKKEIAQRTPDVPYVIHEDEQHERGYSEATLTYYEGDDVLADVDDKIIDNKEDLIGDCAEKFGHGSSDPNVVYLRNERLEVEIELCRSTGTYAEEVHGIRHSDETYMRVRRSSPRDE